MSVLSDGAEKLQEDGITDIYLVRGHADRSDMLFVPSWLPCLAEVRRLQHLR